MLSDLLPRHLAAELHHEVRLIPWRTAVGIVAMTILQLYRSSLVFCSPMVYNPSFFRL